jgi:hypothetical protein
VRRGKGPKTSITSTEIQKDISRWFTSGEDSYIPTIRRFEHGRMQQTQVGEDYESAVG